jgi:hypothetical protein
MKRRKLLKASIGGGATIALMGGGVVWLDIDPGKGPLTIDAALAKLRLLSNKSVASLGEWDPTQVFTHCAQSVEYSMTGFPQHKSAAFKNTLGALAFSTFSSKGRMTHGLNPFPGHQRYPQNQTLIAHYNVLKCRWLILSSIKERCLLILLTEHYRKKSMKLLTLFIYTTTYRR